MPTLAELLALPAGEELDWAIFEMQYRVCFDNGTFVKNGRDVFSNRHTVMRPDYSRTIIGAWPLLAEMLAAGVSVHISAIWDCCEVECYFTGTSREPATIAVPTLADAPLAICRAWLTWKIGGGA